VAQFRDARGIARLGLEPGRAMRVADTMRKAAFSLGEQAGRPSPESFMNRPITAERTLARAELPLSRLLELKSRANVKLNDVVLTVATGALRRFHEKLGAEPVSLRAMIPVSVRSEDDAKAAGNRIVLSFVDLPLDEPRALRRLMLVTSRMGAIKAEGQAAGADVLLRAAGRVPGPIRARMARVVAGSRAFNLTISNVPGPRVPLYAAGAEVESIHPVIPMTEGHGLAIGVLTYRDSLHVAVHANPGVLSDAAGLAELFSPALEELDSVVPVQPAPAPAPAPPLNTGFRSESGVAAAGPA
jgi:WS/DGAT/MGAT family acyltransferase